MKKTYLKVTIKTTTQGAEALAPLLESIGVTSYSIEDPADLEYVTSSAAGAVWDFIDPTLENQGSADVFLSYYLPEDETETVEKTKTAINELKEEVLKGVYGADADFGALDIETGLICDDWEERSKANFHTFSPAKGIVIRPPWQDHQKKEDEVVIIIDPGMAFGTGSHETTSMCLTCLAHALEHRPVARILDVGTGSGILSIYAALRGVEKVVAVEIDEDAAASAAGNIASNGISERIELIIGDVCEPGVLPDDEPYDLILANLTLNLLATILPNLKGRLAPGGMFILSGLLETQESQLRDLLPSIGLECTQIIRQGEWIAVVI